MGKEFSKMRTKTFGKKKMRILMVGLDNAGKTTILYKFRYGETMIPKTTIGFNVETFEFGNIIFNVWDVGGRAKIRPLWRNHYSNIQGVIYVVDCSDRERIDEARDELISLLDSDELKNTALLIFANKMDLPDAMSSSELADKLGLSTRDGPWIVQRTCATETQGVSNGFHWLSEQIL